MKQIEVVPYDNNWPRLFEIEAEIIKKALGDNCIAIHHIGSTSVPELIAKPKIDIIAVVKDPVTSIKNLEATGMQYKGEYNIPLHYGFSKRGEVDVNLHVYEEGHPEIELNLLFRDFLRSNPEACKEYTDLKKSLISDKSSFEKENSPFTNYTLRKGDFIRKILDKAGFNRLRVVKCSDETEWTYINALRKNYFFDKPDPFAWTFKHSDHEHLILYRGTKLIGYTHIELLPNQQSAIRIFILEDENFYEQFLALFEKWLRSRNYKSIYVSSSTELIPFYKSQGYVEMQLSDAYTGNISDCSMVKFLG